MADSILPFDINEYSIPERVAMIAEIWESMADETKVVPLTEEQKAELDKRIAESELYPDDVVSWKDIEGRLFGESS
jgi:putative addiction module component (TIGR02574 family)